MGILTRDIRLVGNLLSLSLHVFRIGITKIEKRGVARIAVVERQERRVEALHLVVHRLDIRANATLVTQAP